VSRGIHFSVGLSHFPTPKFSKGTNLTHGLTTKQVDVMEVVGLGDVLIRKSGSLQERNWNMDVRCIVLYLMIVWRCSVSETLAVGGIMVSQEHIRYA